MLLFLNVAICKLPKMSRETDISKTKYIFTLEKILYLFV